MILCLCTVQLYDDHSSSKVELLEHRWFGNGGKVQDTTTLKTDQSDSWSDQVLSRLYLGNKARDEQRGYRVEVTGNHEINKSPVLSSCRSSNVSQVR